MTPNQLPTDGATVLPDGSAFAVASLPLPTDHWLYAPHEYRDGEVEPVELPAPILNHQAHGETVRAAIRYAIRGATMCGKDVDFDPDALVQNAMYALCGPFGGNTLAALAQQAQEPALYMSQEQLAVFEDKDDAPWGTCIPARKVPGGKFTQPLYTAPPVPQPASAEDMAVYDGIAKRYFSDTHRPDAPQPAVPVVSDGGIDAIISAVIDFYTTRQSRPDARANIRAILALRPQASPDLTFTRLQRDTMICALLKLVEDHASKQRCLATYVPATPDSIVAAKELIERLRS